jgi:RNA polymerase sigma-70 factor (ECF subfamily)
VSPPVAVVDGQLRARSRALGAIGARAAPLQVAAEIAPVIDLECETPQGFSAMLRRLRQAPPFQGPVHPEGENTPAADPLAATARHAARGDVAAIRKLLDDVAPSVLRVARSVLGAGHADVEDVVQETLVGLVAGLPAFRGECSVRHYACRIAVRMSLAARKRARDSRRRLEELESQGAGEAAPQDSPADVALAARRRRLLRMLLDELPEPQAEALVLRVASGLSMQEVADATGAPLNTVRSRLRLAKEALARRLEDDPDLREELEVAGEPNRPAS